MIAVKMVEGSILTIVCQVRDWQRTIETALRKMIGESEDHV